NIRVTCPACKTELEIDAEFEGQEVECGNCLEVFKAKKPGSTGKIPGAGTGSSAGSGSKSADKSAKKKRRDDDDDDDRPRSRRRDDDDDEDDYAPPPPRRRSGGGGNGLGVTSLVLGILSIIPGCCCEILGGPLALGAIASGAIGMSKPEGKPMSIIGVVL